MSTYSSEAQSRRARKRWGDPSKRFWKRVDKSGEHWLWLGSVSKTSGYGTVRFQGKQTSAHRAAFLLSGGKLEPGEEVRHSCDIKLCCRPDHLIAGTHLENMRDMVMRGRQSRHYPALPFQSGSRNIAAKITAEVVRRVRRLYQKGTRQADIARLIGLSRANVWAIVHRKSWTHIK